MKKLILIFSVISVLVFIYAYFFMYNKSHPDYASMNPDFSISAKMLYNDFSNDIEGEKYLGKIIKINGVISDIEKSDSTLVIIFNFEEGMFGDQGVRCSMILPSLDSSLKLGSEIDLKGLCTGYNDTDVLLEYCTIIK
jgi:hypothetical protein